MGINLISMYFLCACNEPANLVKFLNLPPPFEKKRKVRRKPEGRKTKWNT